MPCKDSLSDPLIIKAVETSSGGRIGMTICPGKHQRGGLFGDWCRDLDTDLREINRWGARGLVTLMERHELLEYGVSDLGGHAAEHGLDWWHLPIMDGGVPDESFEQAWRDVGVRLRAHLSAGRSLVVHCRGGLGRTGTVAARLLIESGRSPQEALALVRAARPGAVENAWQERYVLSLAAAT